MWLKMLTNRTDGNVGYTYAVKKNPRFPNSRSRTALITTGTTLWVRA